MAITNVFAANSVSTASGDAFTLAAGDTLNVFAGGYLATSATGFSGVYMPSGNSTAMILGQVWGQNTGMFAQGASAWTKAITIGAGGTVGAANNAIRAETGAGVLSTLLLDNAGQIMTTGLESSGTTRATVYALNANLDIVNSGTIGAHPGFDRAIYGTGTSTRFGLINSGDVKGSVEVTTSASLTATLQNSGDILGSVTFSSSQNSTLNLTNIGTLHGTLSATFGGNSGVWINATGGTFLGNVTVSALQSTLTGQNATFAGSVSLSGIVEVNQVQGTTFRNIGLAFNSTGTLDLNGALILGNINCENGDDRISLIGARVDGTINAGWGNDLVDLTGGFCAKTIVLDLGNDTLIGGDFTETVLDEWGNDLLQLGGGNDTVLIVVGGDNTQRDTMDGGAGIDLIDGQFLSTYGDETQAAAYINLEEGFITSSPWIGNPRVGFSEITGFENVKGGQFNDIIIGQGGANVLAGAEGDDDLQGRDGADILRGGTGQDRLWGQGGKDTLNGGADDDFFVFTAAAESGPTATKRDVIRDFQVGIDKIDLSAIDANTTLAGNQAFTFGGQVTTDVVNGNTLVKVDISGTAAPELTILLIGNLTLTATDFLL